MHIFRTRKINPNLETYRVEAFSDGVFSIAITLLVLSLAVPEFSKQQLASGDLTRYVFSLWPKLVSYIISFTVIGIFWVGHHVMFHYIKKVDRNLLWLNTLFLMFIAFFPFPVSLIGNYPTHTISVMTYGVTLMLAGAVLGSMWLYASTDKRLIDQNLSAHRIKLGRKVVFTGPVLYAISLIVYFIHPLITFILYLLLPIIYLIPSPVDELLDFDEGSDKA